MLDRPQKESRVPRPDLSSLPRLNRKGVAIIVGFTLASLLLSVLFDQTVGRWLDLSPESVRDWIQGLGAAGPLVYVTLVALGVVFSPIPSIPLGIAAGLAFGIWWGTVYSVIGSQIGALVAFFLARRFGRPWVQRYVPADQLDKIDRVSERSGAWAIFVMRLLPAFNFDWVSYGAGLTTMRWNRFALATFFGMLIPVFGVVAVGDALLTDLRRAIFIGGGLLLLAGLPILWFLIAGQSERHPEPAEAETEDEPAGR